MNRDQIGPAIIAGFQSLAPSSQLRAGLIALLDDGIAQEQAAVCAARVSDSEVHRGRGRLGMLLELRDALIDLMNQADNPPLLVDE